MKTFQLWRLGFEPTDLGKQVLCPRLTIFEQQGSKAEVNFFLSKYADITSSVLTQPLGKELGVIPDMPK